jgi:FlaA1/EpsC-like NDP-sugar epimerase
MALHKPDYVFHAAAYKHVPLLEPLARIAIENNIFGTKIVAEAAIKNQAKRFILVSTDKAVNPENVMGATKRVAEMLCQHFNKKSQTQFTIVRFGNVLGSTGSVIPLFREQIASGGPVTVTHPEMERYFMTITEAAQLIIQTVTLDYPSALYVLDMGEPIKIQYLAEQMIKLSGHVPNVDIKISYTGLRPGEKMHEELFYPRENVHRFEQDKILRVDVPPINFSALMQSLTRLKKACHENDVLLKNYLLDLANERYWLEYSVNQEIFEETEAVESV